jgi:CDP-6-deoxy-D-xylo-4-hexulose-3-dehydrase
VFLETRRRNFARLLERFARHPAVFALPRTLAGLETGWHMFPVRIRPESGVRRAALQACLAERGIDSRMVGTGNVLRQPAFRAIRHRVAPGGLANTDRVMEQGLVLPCHHGMDDADVDWIGDVVDAWLAAGGPARGAAGVSDPEASPSTALR